MTSPSEPNPAIGSSQSAGAQAEYLARRSARQRTLADHTRADLTISHARTGTALLAILLAWLAFGLHTVSGWWLIAPGIIFIVLMAVHERVLRRKNQAERAVAFYDAGLRRLENRWI